MITKAQLYLQARDQILALIRIQELGAGDQLPGESELSKQLGVSRTTIREALMTLEQDGLVARRHGVGTFVTSRSKTLRTGLNEVLPIQDAIAAAGYAPGFRELSFGMLAGPSLAHQMLQVDASIALPSVALLYLADTRPAIYVTYYLIPALRPDRVDWSSFDGHLLTFVEQALGIRIPQTHARIHAVCASTDVAERLDVRPGSPLLMLHHLAHAMDGKPVYFSASYQDSNLIEVTVDRCRR